MIIKLILMAILLPTFSWTQNKEYLFEDRQQSRKSYYFIVNGARISDTPDCRKKSCLAYQMTAKKININPKEIPWKPGGVNPTSTLCQLLKAEPKIGFTSKQNEVSLCYFKDRSFIFGWDLMKLTEKR